MIVKSITVYVKPGHLDEYLAAQAVWNRETRKAPEYLGCFCGRDPNRPDVVHGQFFWRSRAALDHWMATDHDRIAALARADDHYERIEVRTLDSALPEWSFCPDIAGEELAEAAVIQGWSEAYRASAALRIAVRLGVFDVLSGEPASIDNLADRLGADAPTLDRLLLALGALGLVARGDGGWSMTGLAERTLVRGATGYQGDTVLHTTQPEYLSRVFAFGERLGLPAEDDGSDEYHARFVRAMANTASAGQADALLAAVDLSRSRTLLDVGGATGPYAIALCRAYPQLTATVLDQPQTVPLAEPILAASGLGDRISIQAHDYRQGRFPEPVDTILISDVLRGETPEMIADILARAREALEPGGQLLIPDLYPEDPPANPGLRAAMFGLHLPRGANYTARQMADALARAGFETVQSRRLVGAVVMNTLVLGVRCQGASSEGAGGTSAP